MTRNLVIERSILHQFGREQSRLVETCYVIGELLSVSGMYNSSIDGMLQEGVILFGGTNRFPIQWYKGTKFVRAGLVFERENTRFS